MATILKGAPVVAAMNERNAASLGIRRLIRRHLFKACALHVALGQMVEVGHVTGAVHVRDVLHRFPGGKAAGDLHGLVLAHAKADDVRAGILGDAGQHGVQPVVIVGKAAQRSFQTT